MIQVIPGMRGEELELYLREELGVEFSRLGGWSEMVSMEVLSRASELERANRRWFEECDVEQKRSHVVLVEPGSLLSRVRSGWVWEGGHSALEKILKEEYGSH